MIPWLAFENHYLRDHRGKRFSNKCLVFYYFISRQAYICKHTKKRENNNTICCFAQTIVIDKSQNISPEPAPTKQLEIEKSLFSVYVLYDL